MRPCIARPWQLPPASPGSAAASPAGRSARRRSRPCGHPRPARRRSRSRRRRGTVGGPPRGRTGRGRPCRPVSRVGGTCRAVRSSAGDGHAAPLLRGHGDVQVALVAGHGGDGVEAEVRTVAGSTSTCTGTAPRLQGQLVQPAVGGQERQQRRRRDGRSSCPRRGSRARRRPPTSRRSRSRRAPGCVRLSRPWRLRARARPGGGRCGPSPRSRRRSARSAPSRRRRRASGTGSSRWRSTTCRAGRVGLDGPHVGRASRRRSGGRRRRSARRARRAGRRRCGRRAAPRRSASRAASPVGDRVDRPLQPLDHPPAHGVDVLGPVDDDAGGDAHRLVARPPDLAAGAHRGARVEVGAHRRQRVGGLARLHRRGR